LKPYFPLRVVKGEGYSVFNPVDNQDYQINLSGYRILELCDGSRTVGEIAFDLTGALRLDAGCREAYVMEFLDEMTTLGMLCWRRDAIPAPGPWAPPQTVFWDVTSACNLRCVHCYGTSESPGPGELSTCEALRVIDEMAACGVEAISFSGGEPLLRKDFIDLAAHAGRQGFKSVGVATNGTLIDESMAQRLRRTGIDVQVSIDGDSAEIHDAQRGVPGAFAKALAGIRNLQQADCPISVCTSATRLNIERIPAIIELMERLGVSRYRVQGLVAMGRGLDNREHLGLEPQRMRELVAYLEERNIRISSYNFTLKPPPAGPVDFCSTGACSAGATICSITSEGRVVPCTYFWGLHGDDLRAHSFGWIWENSRLLNYFRSIRLDDIIGVCRECAWLSVCHGGCKAENFAAGDMFASNRTCWIAKELREGACQEV
jgi:radical SAM protein with 4Fe4S-binding SPASM domain